MKTFKNMYEVTFKDTVGRTIIVQHDEELPANILELDTYKFEKNSRITGIVKMNQVVSIVQWIDMYGHTEPQEVAIDEPLDNPAKVGSKTDLCSCQDCEEDPKTCDEVGDEKV